MQRGQYVVPFSQLRMTDVESVGGKNASLGEMLSQLSAVGLRVPDGFATTADAFRLFLDQGGLRQRIGARLEALNVDDIVRRLIAEEAAEDDIAAAAFSGSRRLADHARQYVESGVTTLEEAIRVAREELVEDAAV